MFEWGFEELRNGNFNRNTTGIISRGKIAPDESWRTDASIGHLTGELKLMKVKAEQNLGVILS